MWRITEPLIQQEGYFSDLRIRRERLLSQLVDNLNKSALVGFGHTEVLPRLRAAWTGAPDRINGYWQAQDCAIRFREYCLAHNLLDFSLTTEVYCQHLLKHPVYQRYFRAQVRHLLVDNLEENVPVTHDLVRWALEGVESAALALDVGAGYRLFLGADAHGAAELAAACSETVIFDAPQRASPHTIALAGAIQRALRVEPPPLPPVGDAAQAVADRGGGKYWISMIRWAADRVAELVAGGCPPGEIALVAPYVNEVMRFTAEEELTRRGVALQLLRPSQPLRADPVVRGLITLVLLAHPDWKITLQGEAYQPPTEDVALMLGTALERLDPVRAWRLAQMAKPYGEQRLVNLIEGEQGGPTAAELAQLWELVGYDVRQRYQTLWLWLETYRQGPPQPVDVFLMRLFADVLARPGYGFYRQPPKARAYGRLVESGSKFREAVGTDAALDATSLAREYVELILGGIAVAEFETDRPVALRPDAVLLAPAYAYLTRDLTSRHQFWLDLSSDGWWSRPNQPLTHPYVLSRHWPVGQPWRDVEEDLARRETLAKLALGLACRCTGQIWLGFSDLGLDGAEQGGRFARVLLNALAGRGVRHER
jgi:hypothetical protein